MPHLTRLDINATSIILTQPRGHTPSFYPSFSKGTLEELRLTGIEVTSNSLSALKLLLFGTCGTRLRSLTLERVGPKAILTLCTMFHSQAPQTLQYSGVTRLGIIDVPAHAWCQPTFEVGFPRLEQLSVRSAGEYREEEEGILWEFLGTTLPNEFILPWPGVREVEMNGRVVSRFNA